MSKLKAWRKERGWNITKAGQEVGVSGIQWHRYESGDRQIPLERLPDVVRLTGIPANELRPDLAAQINAIVSGERA